MADDESQQRGEQVDDRLPPHVPDPTSMVGNLDTSGTGGAGGHSLLHNVAPIFRVAEAHDLAYAARAVDPNDPGVSEDMVQTSTGLTVVQGDPEGDRQRVTQRAREARELLGNQPISRGFDEQGRFHIDRRARDERAWAAQVADLGAPTVIGPPELGQVAVSPALVINSGPEDERAPEDQTASVPDPGTQTSSSMTEGGAQEDTGGSAESEPGSATPVSTEPSGGPQEPPVPSSEPLAPSPEVRAPNKASSKQEWVDWAVACGADRAEADGKSRLQLISEYSKYRPNER